MSSISRSDRFSGGEILPNRSLSSEKARLFSSQYFWITSSFFSASRYAVLARNKLGSKSLEICLSNCFNLWRDWIWASAFLDMRSLCTLASLVRNKRFNQFGAALSMSSPSMVRSSITLCCSSRPCSAFSNSSFAVSIAVKCSSTCSCAG